MYCDDVFRNPYLENQDVRCCHEDCGCRRRCCPMNICDRCCRRCIDRKEEGMQVTLTGSGGEEIPNGGNVIFNNIINDRTKDIKYNTVNGEFTVKKSGKYLINWWIAVNSPALTQVSFAVRYSGGADVIASTPLGVDQLSGTALITVDDISIIRLVNVTGSAVTLANTPVQASLVINEI